MKIVPLNNDPVLNEAFQEFVDKHQLFFNSAAWLKNYNEQQLKQCLILNNNNDIIGCFIYYVFKKAFLKFIISPPFTPGIDLFYINPSDSVVGKNSFNKDVQEVLVNYFESQNAAFINLNLPFHIIDTQPFIWKGYTSRTRYSYLIDLAHSEETLKNNLASSKRRSLAKAEKDGLTIKETNDYQLVYSLILQSLERNDVAKNKTILKNILFTFANAHNAIAFVASNDNKAIGATFCLVNNQKVIYLLGGFDAENKHHGAGVSCMWQSILKAKQMGLKHFDFEGSMDPDIERYFRDFGGELTPYYSVEKIKTFLKPLLHLKGHRSV